MDLKSRKAIKKFQDEFMPDLTKEIQDAAGFAVPIELDWDTLGKGSIHARRFHEAFPVIFA